MLTCYHTGYATGELISPFHIHNNELIQGLETSQR